MDVFFYLDKLSRTCDRLSGDKGSYVDSIKECLGGGQVIFISQETVQNIEESLINAGEFKLIPPANFPFDMQSLVINDEKYGFFSVFIKRLFDDVFGLSFANLSECSAVEFFYSLWLMIDPEDGRVRLLGDEADATAITDKFFPELAILFQAMNFLLPEASNTSSLQRKMIPPGLFKNRKRRSFFQFKKIKIEANRRGSGDYNKTDRKQSFHYRRGHWRRVKSGKIVFVRSCTSGSANVGIVKKEYEV